MLTRFVPKKTARCINGKCVAAHRDVDVGLGAPMVCVDCTRPLVFDPKKRQIWRPSVGWGPWLLVPCLVWFVAGALGLQVLRRSSPSTDVPMDAESDAEILIAFDARAGTSPTVESEILHLDNFLPPRPVLEAPGSVRGGTSVLSSAKERIAEEHVAEGRGLMIQGKHEAARRAFSQAVEEDPKAPFAWANLGAAEMILHRRDSALDAYDEALRLDPTNWLAHYNLGLHATRSDDFDTAFRHFSASLASLQKSAAHRQRLAVIDGLLTDPELAKLRQQVRFQELFNDAR